jgi:serine/threonine protein kinase
LRGKPSRKNGQLRIMAQIEQHSGLNDDHTQLVPGEVVDAKYEIICQIGRGRMGVVYRARSLGLNRDAALKMLTHANRNALDVFLRSAASMGQVRHRAVVRIDDFGNTERWGPYLAMAYVPGTDLASFASTNQLSVQQAVDLTLAICSGVAACHLQSIVHGDLKPSNVRVTRSGQWQDRVKILDFGLALPVNPGVSDSSYARATESADAIRFLPPELLRNEPPSQRGDQYAIASLLYLLLAGHAPFRAVDGKDLVRSILAGDRPSLRLTRPDAPAALQSAVEVGMETDPERRYPTVEDLGLAILSHASPTLQHLWNRYFAKAKVLVDRRLVEPVSTPRRSNPAGGMGRVVKISAPMVTEPLDNEKAPELENERRPVSRPKTTSSASLTQSRSRTELRTLLVFSLGALVGAALAVGVFLSILIYQQHRASSVPSADWIRHERIAGHQAQ